VPGIVTGFNTGRHRVLVAVFRTLHWLLLIVDVVGKDTRWTITLLLLNCEVVQPLLLELQHALVLQLALEVLLL
jgi:hypothetical protein